MTDYCAAVKQAAALYPLLQDDMSRDIFWRRLQHDVDPSWENALRLCYAGQAIDETELQLQLGKKYRLTECRAGNKKLLLYGAGQAGRAVGGWLSSIGCEWDGFCDRNYQNLSSEGVLGKPVFPPEYLLENQADSCVLICNREAYREIKDFLTDNGFPDRNILPHYWYFLSSSLSAEGTVRERQYFEFPELFSKGTAFVDGGCYDGADSLFFADWCQGEYSEILAFEPDPDNYAKCMASLNRLERIQLFQAGLGMQNKEQFFLASATSGSCFVETLDAPANTIMGAGFDVPVNVKRIRITAIDVLAEHVQVGFIKLDVEGYELEALQGAEQTIIRDKPLLAVCVYHKPGDVLAMMDYIHQLEPGYRFWLRHYFAFSSVETVLYAAICK